MTDITTFIRARADESERDAQDIHDLSVDAYLDGDCVCDYPARVLAQVAAMRAVVEAAQEYSPELEHGDNGEWAFDATLAHLATIWSSHPDYDPAWAPEGE